MVLHHHLCEECLEDVGEQEGEVGEETGYRHRFDLMAVTVATE